MLETLFWISVLIVSIIAITFSSSVAVKHSAILATILGVSPLIIGVTLVSFGTDISEIVNSIISCYLGHGDIDVGDSVGSDLTQLTLVFGLLPFFCGSFVVNKKQVTILGACEILSLILIYSVVVKGYFLRLDAILMVLSLSLYFIIIYTSDSKEEIQKHVEIIKDEVETKSKSYHFILAIFGFIGVFFSSYFIIESVIFLSQFMHIHEYIISFVIVAIGTSLPELVVDVRAIRSGETELAIGDLIGSCIVDSTFSIGIGQALFPQAVSAYLIVPTILYTMCVSIIVFMIAIKRQKMDKKSGIIYIMLYFGSYILIFNL